MFAVHQNSMLRPMRKAALMMLLVTLLGLPLSMFAGKKKKEATVEKPLIERLDYSRIIWPNPPAITRLRYVDFFAAEKVPSQDPQKQKGAWMDRLSGAATGETKNDKPLFQ